MTNETLTPAPETNADDAVQPIGEDQALARAPKVPLHVPEEFVTIVKPPEGVFAPVVVAESVESALALASANLLPGPAKVLAALSLEGLAALRLPEQAPTGGFSSQNPGRIVIAPDGAPESRRAAHHAARRARAAGWTVDLLPAPEGSRWADVLGGRASPPEEDLARIGDLFVPWPAVDPRDTASDLVDDIGDGLA